MHYAESLVLVAGKGHCIHFADVNNTLSVFDNRTGMKCPSFPMIPGKYSHVYHRSHSYSDCLFHWFIFCLITVLELVDFSSISESLFIITNLSSTTSQSVDIYSLTLNRLHIFSHALFVREHPLILCIK